MNNECNADLVLEGGGVKGIALAGAVSMLEERGYRFRRVAGTSAGSLVGSLVAAGIRGDRLREMMQSVSLRQFRDPPVFARYGPLGAFISVMAYKGWCKGDRLRSWVAECLQEAGVQTFADLPLDDEGAAPELQDDPDRRFRFVAMVSDLSQGRLVTLPWEYRARFGVDPNEASVADAVRASSAIPYFFRPARCPDQLTGEQAWLVDGGMLSNFPIGVFDRVDAEPRWPTFGIKLSGDPAALRVNRIGGVFSLSRAMLSTMTGFYDRLQTIRPEVVARTIVVDTNGVSATDFDLSASASARLFENGRQAAALFLDGDGRRPAWDFEAYKNRFRRPRMALT
ncbi:patatin-like phospholipase family protein [Actinoplanes sp. NEAU-A12]|uniref:Patatin-like phospholipase family protein n=1 Tax=Actinoplanes sandaracinus TaxID=3045177 RepID=A0ABT6WYW8_9ACTN|nr:patatin-like phospholipase family protein [Actinoplanes sandaracinus]MDI6104932.1 patatin-like phospholipase family protein [Actinoplanes sandaracinus]